MTTERVVVGISGASGAALGVRIVERLAALPGIETHLVVSDAARRTLALECGPETLERLPSLAHHHHPIGDIGASLASGSFPVRGMIVAPCSMQTLSSIATGRTDTLLTRAADVQLKERRRLVLLARETPLHLGHLRHMVALAEMGAVILPPAPSFYHAPKTIMDVVDQTVGKVLDQFEISHELFRRWDGHGA